MLFQFLHVPDEFPSECAAKLLALLREKRLISLEGAECVLIISAWVVKWVRGTMDPVIGANGKPPITDDGLRLLDQVAAECGIQQEAPQSVGDDVLTGGLFEDWVKRRIVKALVSMVSDVLGEEIAKELQDLLDGLLNPE
jgi:hypothetical protein